MLIKIVRSRRILSAAVFAVAALLGLSGCNNGSSSVTTVTPTSVALSTNVTSVNLGSSVTLTASLGYGANIPAPIGVVTFFDGTNVLQATSITGNTTISTTQALTAGVHSITASYAGDQTHAASTSSAITITVYVPTTTTLAASPALAANAAPVTLTATVAAGLNVPTGSVIFYAGTTALGTASLSAVSGSEVATLVTTALTTGITPTTYSITASYVASTYFLASTSSAVSVVIHPTPVVTNSALTLSSLGPIASGTQETISATVTAVSAGTAAPGGTITFYDTNTTVTPNTVLTLGTATVTSGSSTTATASIATKQFNVGSTNSITAVYSGDAIYAASTSPATSLTMNAYTGSTYTNPLTLTDTVNNTGAVYNCPDPAIVKSQASGVDTWYAYCTGDAFNNSDSATNGGPLRAHLISIFSSSDLVHWTYVSDAFAALPGWAASGTELYEPAIKLIGGNYMLYFRGITNAANTVYSGGTGYAIGVGTAASPAGPFTYTSASTPLVADYAACGNTCNATTLAPEVVYDGTHYWLSYGGTFGGLYIQQLNATGTAITGAKTSIAIDNYYTNPYIMNYNGYYYLFATPAGSCCSGVYSTYSVRVGRSTSITGPYLDAEGNDMNAAAPSNGQTQGEPGGDTVLVNTGNTIYGPGSNTVFADEAGQYYVLYSGISGNRACLTSGTTSGSTCYTARQLMMDPIDWVNGWPVVRGGTGDSDQAQPVPASQPNATNGYVTPVYTKDAPGTLMAAYSQDFTGATSFSSEFSFIHQNPNTVCQSDSSGGFAAIAGDNPGFSASGYTLCSNFAASDSSYPGDTMAQLPILAEVEPAGNYLIEIKFHSLVPPTTCCTANYSSQGLLVYSNDNTYLRLDEAANFDTRQIEFLNQLSSLSNDFYAPGGTPNGGNYTYLRLAKRITNTTTGAATYTSYSSVDGVTYVRGPAWDVSYGTSGTKVGIFSGNTGFGAVFSYIHVSTLTP
jgi:arabinan endo-1,5-alpha-L-arabinosidase